MAVGDPTLTDHGMFKISGGTLKTAVDALTQIHPVASGGAIYLLPSGAGQINLIEVKYD